MKLHAQFKTYQREINLKMLAGWHESFKSFSFKRSKSKLEPLVKNSLEINGSVYNFDQGDVTCLYADELN